MAVLAPLLWSPLRSAPPVPEGVRARYQPGLINVVEFSDFECSHCRDLHPRLLTLLADYPGQVNHVRMNAPLSGHSGARPAARASICAEAQGEGGRMAETLFRAASLTEPDLLVYARSLGLDMTVFEQCLRDPATDQRIDQEIAILESSGLFVTPTTFIGSRRIPGAQPDHVFRAALEEARHGGGDRGVSAPVYITLAGGLLLLLVFLSRRPWPVPARSG
jgi:protein-disulfide isomerase